MTSRLIDCLATTEALAEMFSDQSVLQAMLDFEVALVRAAAAAGAVPASAARVIAAAARPDAFDAAFDAAALARDARQSATPSIALVKALRDKVQAIDAASAPFVHWGATSQDVADTALVLLLARARPRISADHQRITHALRSLSDRHASTLMLGRTLLQPATPITFGLKTAGWYAAASRAWLNLETAWQGALVVQLGGAAGTRAAFGVHADAIASHVARELGLANSPPWHTDRTRLGAFVSACGVYVMALGKIARDIALLMQFEVGEAAEQGGGSSTMPQKQNPSGSTVAIAAATRMPGLVAAFLGAMLQEHERAAGGSQAEWPTIAAAVQTTGAAAAAMASVVDGLSVDAAKMRANLEATHGTVLAERAASMLTPALGRETAQAAVTQAVRAARDTGAEFVAVLQAMPEVGAALPADAFASLADPAQYLGDSEPLRRALLADAT